MGTGIFLYKSTMQGNKMSCYQTLQKSGITDLHRVFQELTRVVNGLGDIRVDVFRIGIVTAHASWHICLEPLFHAASPRRKSHNTRNLHERMEFGESPLNVRPKRSSHRTII